MDELGKALNKAFSGCKTLPSEEAIARLISDASELLAELERPQYRQLMRFAVSWCELQQELNALKRALDERLSQKKSGPFDELFEQLRAKN